jgi:hypothetical protein
MMLCPVMIVPEWMIIHAPLFKVCRRIQEAQYLIAHRNHKNMLLRYKHALLMYLARRRYECIGETKVLRCKENKSAEM